MTTHVPSTGEPVHSWAHGWVPLTMRAALAKAHGNHKQAEKLLQHRQERRDARALSFVTPEPGHRSALERAREAQLAKYDALQTPAARERIKAADEAAAKEAGYRTAVNRLSGKSDSELMHLRPVIEKSRTILPHEKAGTLRYIRERLDKKPTAPAVTVRTSSDEVRARMDEKAKKRAAAEEARKAKLRESIEQERAAAAEREEAGHQRRAAAHEAKRRAAGAAPAGSKSEPTALQRSAGGKGGALRERRYGAASRAGAVDPRGNVSVAGTNWGKVEKVKGGYLARLGNPSKGQTTHPEVFRTKAEAVGAIVLNAESGRG